MIQRVPTKMHYIMKTKYPFNSFICQLSRYVKCIYYTYFYRKFYVFILFDNSITRYFEIKSPHNWYTRYSIEGIHIVYAKKTFSKRLSKTRNTSKVYILTWSTRREFSSIYIKDENTNDYNPDSIFCWSAR